jgi:hypothetical protein
LNKLNQNASFNKSLTGVESKSNNNINDGIYILFLLKF